MIQRHDRPQPRGEGNSVLWRVQIQLASHHFLCQSEVNQRPIRRKCVSMFQAVQPHCQIQRPRRNPCVHPVHSHHSANGRRIVRGCIRSRACRNPKSQIQQPVPNCRRSLVVAEADDLHVIQFAQRHIHGQFICNSLGRIRKRIRLFIERMHRAYKRALLVSHVVYVRIHRKQTRRRCIWISRIARQQQTLLHVQQAPMPPIAGMKFLACDYQYIRFGQ